MNRALLLILFLLLSACSDQSQITPFEGNAMTMQYRIMVAAPLSYFQKREVEKVIADTFYEVNATYNIWNPHSEISKVNQLPAHTKMAISKELVKLLQFTDDIVSLTEGRFDPTVSPLQKLWKQKLEMGTIPSKQEIEKVQPALGWNKIHLEKNVFWKEHALTSIDLGGIAKGYCVDLIIERINDLGYQNLYVEWGGEIRASGKHPDNRPWRIFITSLGDTDPDNAIATVEMKDQAIATSGDYLQFWTIKGIKYTHIINPKTGKPLTTINSASILAPNCTLADGLATAALLFDTIEEAEEWLSSLDEKITYWLK